METSALQAIQAQQVASKARDREKVQTPSGRRLNDLVELRVSGVETTEAVRALPQNNSEQADIEHDAHHPLPTGDEQARPRLDVKA